MRKTIALALLTLLIGCNEVVGVPLEADAACNLVEKDNLQPILATPVAFEVTQVDNFERRKSGLGSRCKVLFVDLPAPKTFAEQFKQPSIVLSLYNPDSYAAGNKLREEKGNGTSLDFNQHWDRISGNQAVEEMGRGQGFVRETAVGSLKEIQGILRVGDLLVVVSAANLSPDTVKQVLNHISEQGKF
ncbi:hypothetical protein [Alteromonas sp. AMM-1]|uniref:hypothetical protein n=1 Tax=Alteromonas sp. AMM-1 TaxID=3394233 RepID=UPI0039A50014